jgi:DNA polymerase III subunit epsilon
MELDVLAVGVAGFLITLLVLLRLTRLGFRHSAATPAKHKASKSSRGHALAEHVHGNDWLVLDLETTGLSSSSEIIEIAVVDAGGSVIFNQRVMPKGRIPKRATEIHGIDRKALKGQPTWPEIAGRVTALLKDRPVLTYNAEFDLRLLRQTFKKWGLPPMPIEGHCVMLAYAEHRGILNPRFPGEYKWHKLKAACAHERIIVAPDHSAAADAKATHALVAKMYGRRQLLQAAE